jgi:hypothetical protein
MCHREEKAKLRVEEEWLTVMLLGFHKERFERFLKNGRRSKAI